MNYNWLCCFKNLLSISWTCSILDLKLHKLRKTQKKILLLSFQTNSTKHYLSWNTIQHSLPIKLKGKKQILV